MISGKNLTTFAQTYPAILLAYLFGSQVRGRTGPLSDFDFAILLDRGSQTPALQAHLHHELALLVGTGRVDVVWLPRAPIELQYAVISQGVCAVPARLGRQGGIRSVCDGPLWRLSAGFAGPKRGNFSGRQT